MYKESMIYHIDWLKDRFAKGETIKYIFFWGHSKGSEEVGKFVFSQWFYSPFTVDGIEYKTSEHWMMTQKANLFSDAEIAKKILLAEKPGEVKELGRQIKGFDELKWNEEKYEIVKAGSIHKFQQSKILRDFLIGTGERILVEASPTDAIWGIGLPQNAKSIEDPYTWRGLNLLGFALMETRDFLKEN
jgi:ribA/ribD-fused uncharacterized protein